MSEKQKISVVTKVAFYYEIEAVDGLAAMRLVRDNRKTLEPVKIKINSESARLIRRNKKK